MSFVEYLNFLFDNAFFQMPFIEAVTAILIALSLGAVLVGMLWKLPGGGRSVPPAQVRKAA